MVCKKIMLTIFAICVCIIANAQEKEIVNILNKELKTEVKNQFKNNAFSGDTLLIVKPFAIDANKVLSVTVKQYNPQTESYTTIEQEVALSNIKNVGKDIKVLFTTKGDNDVTVVTKSAKDKEWKENKNLFRVWFSGGTNNNALGEKIRKVFSKTDYNIELNDWLD